MFPLTLGVVLLSSLIILFSPLKNQKIVNPIPPSPSPSEVILLVPHPSQALTLESGKILRGAVESSWVFEGVFPVIFTDTSGEVIYQTQARAQPSGVFEVTLDYPTTAPKDGFLILRADNPSGLPENDHELKFPVIFN